MNRYRKYQTSLEKTLKKLKLFINVLLKGKILNMILFKKKYFKINHNFSKSIKTNKINDKLKNLWIIS